MANKHLEKLKAHVLAMPQDEFPSTADWEAWVAEMSDWVDAQQKQLAAQAAAPLPATPIVDGTKANIRRAPEKKTRQQVIDAAKKAAPLREEAVKKGDPQRVT